MLTKRPGGPSASPPIVETAYNGVNLEEFDREKDYAEAPTCRETILLLWRHLTPQRRLHVLLDAFVRYPAIPKVHLDIIGYHQQLSPRREF